MARDRVALRSPWGDLRGPLHKQHTPTFWSWERPRATRQISGAPEALPPQGEWAARPWGGGWGEVVEKQVGAEAHGALQLGGWGGLVTGQREGPGGL